MKIQLLVLSLLMSGLSSFSQVSPAEFNQQIEKHREEYKHDFTTDANSPLVKKDLKKLRFFEPDVQYKVLADVELLKEEAPFKMATFDGKKKDYVRYAVLHFKLQGQPLSLTIYRSIDLMKKEQYKDYLFLPFTDQTNGTESYGGGRYIDLKTSDLSARTFELDFNKAYNPYCAYSTGYSCPLPPEENDLQVAVKAGEKNFAGKKKHKD